MARNFIDFLYNRGCREIRFRAYGIDQKKTPRIHGCAEKKHIATTRRRSTNRDLLPCRLPAGDRSHPPASPPSAQPLNRKLIKAIDEYEGEDPLQPWFACIKWVQDAFPPGGDCSGLVVILEQCVRTFWHEEQYKNDIRYLKVWLEYAGYCDDAEVVYGFLNTNKIGEMHAIFYISYATHLESKNKIKTANNIYECGIARNAQPIEKLKSAYRKFFTRSMSRPKAIEEESLDTCQPTRSFGTILTKADSGNRPLDSCEIARKRQKQEGCSHDFRVLNKAIDY
ncbi:hypothetical protein LXL04_028134 [Taraxacum kok-saghyz]